MVYDIIDMEIDIIFVNQSLWLTSSNINFDTLKNFMFRNIKELQVNLALFLIFLKRTFTIIRDYILI